MGGWVYEWMSEWVDEEYIPITNIQMTNNQIYKGMK